MIRTINCRLLLVALLLGVSDVRAVEADHGPFEPGESLTPFPLVAIPASSEPKGLKAPQLYEFTDRLGEGKTAIVKILMAADRPGPASFTLVVNGVTKFSGQVDATPLDEPSVYRADLNGDGIPDYAVIIYNGGGCGLGAEISWVTFLLSSPAGYAKVDAFSWDAASTDVVNIGGCAYLVQTSFVYGEKGKDGRSHNYWVYHLLRIDGKTLVLDNAADRRFPKWVLYTFAPNHRDTDQLTPEQRDRLWRQYVKEYPDSLGGD